MERKNAGELTERRWPGVVMGMGRVRALEFGVAMPSRAPSPQDRILDSTKVLCSLCGPPRVCSANVQGLCIKARVVNQDRRGGEDWLHRRRANSTVTITPV